MLLHLRWQLQPVKIDMVVVVQVRVNLEGQGRAAFVFV